MPQTSTVWIATATGLLRLRNIHGHIKAVDDDDDISVSLVEETGELANFHTYGLWCEAR